MAHDRPGQSDEERRNAWLDRVCAAATATGVSGIDASLFLRRYFEHTDPTDAELGDTPQHLAALAHSHLHFASSRKPREGKVRVFNPTLEQHGYASVHTCIETVTDDMPFLVDSLRMALQRRGCAVHGLVHPLLEVARDDAGRLRALATAPRNGTTTESFIHFAIVRETDAAVLRDIERELELTLADVRVAVDDWRAMLAKLRATAGRLRDTACVPAELRAETAALLDWLAADHFTLLGYREYDLLQGEPADELRTRPGTGLGLLRPEPPADAPVVRLAGRGRAEARSREPIVVTKSSLRSTVHRPALLDHVGVKVFDADGRTIGEQRFLGLFTSSAYSASPRLVPLVRLKMRQILDRSGMDPRSHSGRALEHVLDTLPRDDLFQATTEDLRTIGLGVVALEERHRVRLFCRRETFGRFYSCLVYLPRDHYGARARRRIEETLLRGLGGTSVESEGAVGESALARVRVTVQVDPRSTDEPDVPALQAQLAAVVRTWHDALRARLLERLPEHEALALFKRYADSFTAAYREDADADRASHDLDKIATVDAGTTALTSELVRVARSRVRLTVCRGGEAIPLYVALPILESFGLRVASEHLYPVRGATRAISLQDFELDTPIELDPPAVEARFSDCFVRVLRGEIESDGFNAFVLSAGLDWREAMLLRAACKYLLQTPLPYSQAYMLSVLGRHPAFCRALMDEVAGSFDVDRTDADRAALRARAAATIATELERTSSLDDDRILRAFAVLVAAILRTNYYQRGADGAPKPYVSFKLDAHAIPTLPKPRPQFEIFVYSRRMEGIHLRGAHVARGGIRWSDRLEDFRTEILGLMKAQQVKNAVIVPNGAKGGFVCKTLPSGDREAVQREVVACYETLIRGLLDVTDNIVDGAVVPPARTVRRDGDDPYLVVAADKGTASFSDRANALAAEYGFWLGDAFASGGSTGYDHKKLGITARGAWEAVRRHFRELGRDPNTQDFTAIGIGDMSGDVFGNGLLLSPHTKLVAAFDHRHVFLDPSPDPAASYAERTRLFALPRSSWDDYDRSVLSRGGGIHSRQSKSIELSAEARAALGIADAALSPPDLIRAILRAPVDLLWNGGIGTYVKSSRESHADAGDPGNDAVRVDGRELRCVVVAEGGNLGFTQRGRVEYALDGGRINTDFIDNSGGVDSSDREVNCKILLEEALRGGQITRDERNALLAAATDEIAALVLRDNYSQTLALSVIESGANAQLDEHVRLIRALEAKGSLDRAVESLPSEAEIEERRARGVGLTRPELAVVMSYAKLDIVAGLERTDIPEDAHLGKELAAYFPTELSQRFGPLLYRHRLWRQIVVLLVGGSIVNRLGPTFALRATEETGASLADVARAYAIARAALGARKLWREIESLDGRVPAAAQYRAILAIGRHLRRAVYWLVQNARHDLAIEPLVRRLGPGAALALEQLPNLIAGRGRERLDRDTRALESAGLPATVAAQVAALRAAPQIFDVVELGAEFGLDAALVARQHFALAAALGLDAVGEQIDALAGNDRWRALARATLRENLHSEQRLLLRRALTARGITPDQAVDAWLVRERANSERFRRLIEEMQAAGPMDFATVSVALKELSRLR